MDLDGDDEDIRRYEDMRHEESTKATYAGKWRQFAKWVVEKTPQCLNGEGSLPADCITARTFCKFLIYQHEERNNGRQSLEARAPPPPALAPPLRHLSSRLHLQLFKAVWKDEWSKATEKEFPKQYEAKLKKVLTGMGKSEAKQRQEGTRKPTEGKAPMPFEVYMWLCTYYMRHGLVFAWLYLTLAWNLIGRTNTIANIALSHLSWCRDSLGIQIPTSKGNKSSACSVGVVSLVIYFCEDSSS
jgi:hypothetical protein